MTTHAAVMLGHSGSEADGLRAETKIAFVPARMLL
jgi:hypothetical protein